MKEAVIYDLKDIFQQVYGYKPMEVPGFPSDSAPENPHQIQANTQKRSTFNGTAIYGMADLIGREVFLPVTIQAAGVDYDFPFSVIGIRGKKTLVETPMVERRGSVKELISVDDWQITIKGFLIDEFNQFPDVQLFRLKQLFLHNEPVRLKCALTDLFLEDNDFVVIKDLNIPEQGKVIGVRDFTMSLVSDSILTLTVD